MTIDEFKNALRTLLNDAMRAGLGGGNDPIASILASHADLAEERDRFRAGLLIIKASGAVHGGAWCTAQARGYLEDLDFDMYPDAGKPPI